MHIVFTEDLIDITNPYCNWSNGLVHRVMKERRMPPNHRQSRHEELHIQLGETRWKEDKDACETIWNIGCMKNTTPGGFHVAANSGGTLWLNSKAYFLSEGVSAGKCIILVAPYFSHVSKICRLGECETLNCYLWIWVWLCLCQHKCAKHGDNFTILSASLCLPNNMTIWEQHS